MQDIRGWANAGIRWPGQLVRSGWFELAGSIVRGFRGQNAVVGLNAALEPV